MEIPISQEARVRIPSSENLFAGEACEVQQNMFSTDVFARYTFSMHCVAFSYWREMAPAIHCCTHGSSLHFLSFYRFEGLREQDRDIHFLATELAY
jgi:hypothetical protein